MRKNCVLQIRQCLGRQLFPWQIKYIFGISFEVPIERGTGKTFAHMLRAMISEGPKLVVRSADSIEVSLISDYDFVSPSCSKVQYNRQYLREFKRLYDKLKKETTIPLREIEIHTR